MCSCDCLHRKDQGVGDDSSSWQSVEYVPLATTSATAFLPPLTYTGEQEKTQVGLSSIFKLYMPILQAWV